jgi:hypothetical protein
MKALLLIDIQNDFLPGGALAVPRSDEVIDVANELMRTCRSPASTQESKLAIVLIWRTFRKSSGPITAYKTVSAPSSQRI